MMLQKIKAFMDVSLKKTSFLLFFPLLCKYIFIVLFLGFELITGDEIIEDLIFYLLILILVVSIRKSLIALFFVAVYVFYFILETTSYIAVSSNFTSSFMYVLIETSKDEFSEFASSYFNYKIVLYVALAVISFFFLRKHIVNHQRKNRLVFSIVFIGFTVAFLKFTGLIESNAYHNIVRGAYGYFELQNNFKLSAGKVDENDLNITSANDVLVIVLGESTTRGHMQIYGYEKPTTPLLNSIKQGLYVYDNVISTDILTLKSIPKMLTSISQGEKIGTTTGLINIFKGAGYKTFWLSNQVPIGYHDNAISEIASTANYFKFFNHVDFLHTSILDEVMLPDYKQILKREGKQVIIFRLIGTHFDYKKRYPESFNIFKPVNDTEKEKIRSYYDNAVLYNDFIVFSILDELKKINKKSAFIYLSDHGENVYDYGDFFGRNEANLKQNMFEIPFLVWTSEDFEKPADFEYQKNRKFMADHLYESVGHLFGVMHKNMDKGRSIFSETFKERERVVVNDINFDNYFLKQ